MGRHFYQVKADVGGGISGFLKGNNAVVVSFLIN